MPVEQFGAALFPTTASSDIIGGITGAVTDNAGLIVALLGFGIGLRLVLRLVNKSHKGKV